jgi:uncharacterized protein YbaR (Trm112 family)
VAIKNLVCRGIGFVTDSTTKWIPTQGFSIGAALVYTPYGAFFPVEDSVPRFLEVHMRAVTGTAHARLFDVTGAAEVAGSTISTMSATMARVRSAVRLALTEGSEYQVEFSATDGKKQAGRLTQG